MSNWFGFPKAHAKFSLSVFRNNVHSSLRCCGNFLNARCFELLFCQLNKIMFCVNLIYKVMIAIENILCWVTFFAQGQCLLINWANSSYCLWTHSLKPPYNQKMFLSRYSSSRQTTQTLTYTSLPYELYHRASALTFQSFQKKSYFTAVDRVYEECAGLYTDRTRLARDNTRNIWLFWCHVSISQVNGER